MKEKGFLISVGLVLTLMTGGLGYAHAEEIIIHGIGYPPIRVDDKVQALLLARRAAVLNAYAHALQKKSTATAPAADPVFYNDLSGFIRGMTVIRQHFLADGGVEVVMRGETDNIEIQTRGAARQDKGVAGAAERKKVSDLISQEEWFQVIEGKVDISRN